MTESAGRARLAAELRDHAEGYEREARALDNEFAEPDDFCKARGGDSARQVAKLMRAAADALLGLEDSPSVLENAVIALGRDCATWITGDPDDGLCAMFSTDTAMAAIREAIRLGQERNNELKAAEDSPEPPRWQLQKAIDLLKRLYDWDVMGLPNSGGAYWRKEIIDVVAPVQPVTEADIEWAKRARPSQLNIDRANPNAVTAFTPAPREPREEPR